MRLDIPFYKQGRATKDCGPVCLQMMLAYYGQNVSLSDIKKEIDGIDAGTSMPSLGSFMMKQGYKAEIVTLNPKAFYYGLHGEEDQNVIRDHLLKSKDKTIKDNDRQVLGHMLEFMENGGTYRLDVPQSKHIRQEISQGRPLIALLTTDWLYDRDIFNFHFNVVTGITDKHVHVNDPLREKPNSLPIGGFMHAVHTTAYGDLDNDSFLLIQKPA